VYCECEARDEYSGGQMCAACEEAEELQSLWDWRIAGFDSEDWALLTW
jgi:hypothetical protein